jgi:hypothetical protein
MNKGFVISITTFFYVVLFLAFLSIMIVTFSISFFDDKQIQQQALDSIKFVSSQDSITNLSNDQWCTRYFYYDANNNISGYNDVSFKKYCEGYNGKRFI